MRRVVRRVLFCTVIPLIAQRDRGTITGAISDPAAAIIAGAKVVAQHTETGTTSETQTTSTGNYTLPAITAGVYDVSVTATGFSRLLQRAVRVRVAQTVRTDMTLQVGSTTDSITVTGAAPLLRTENAEQSINVTGERINKLPLLLPTGVIGNRCLEQEAAAPEPMKKESFRVCCGPPALPNLKRSFGPSRNAR